MKHLGDFIYNYIENYKTISKQILRKGFNDVGNHIINVNENSEIIYIIDKICDHAGGRLIVKNDKAICPMHGWKLDLLTLNYNDSHVCKEKLEWEDKNEGDIVIKDRKRNMVNPFKKDKKGLVKVRWLNHATVHIECNNIKIICDPWLFGPAFMTGWWLAGPSPQDSIQLLKEADFVYISHNHPDHLHAETLAVLNRDKNIIVGDFQSKSCEKYLKSLQFTNINVVPFSQLFELTEGFQFSIFKSGDFRDDSGIYICANGIEILLTVDANFLNSHTLPENIDLLMTNFAGGASGFPLCFNNFSQEEKEGIIKRNRGSMKAAVMKYVQCTNPVYYMPYAGMFGEYADRDGYILAHNYKNTPKDYASLLKQTGTKLLDPQSDQLLLFNNGILSMEKLAVSYLQKEDTIFYINKLKEEYAYDSNKIIDYLKEAGFTGKQVLQIIPSSDDFKSITGKIVYADFYRRIFKTIVTGELEMAKEGYKVMQLRIRPEVIMCIIENKLPWEDFSIGFQVRIDRYPNEYESEFWYHFTNNYVGKENFRYASFCGACTVIDQNPIWINN